MNILRYDHRRYGILVAGVLAVVPLRARAASYAGELNLDGTSGSFYLNEAASSYTISFSDGPSITVENPSAGLQDFQRPTATDTFSISITTHDAAGWTSGVAEQIGTDSPLTTFNSPGGITVNKNPGPDFGLIYVANGAAQTTPITSASGVVRASAGQGLYALNSDQSDTFGYGNTAMNGGISQIATGPSTVDTGVHFSPVVGTDNNVYVADASEGNIYRLNANLTAGYNLLYGFPTTTAEATVDNHGNFFGTPAVKIDSSGNTTLYAIDNLLSTATPANYQAIRAYNIGNETAAPTAPVPQTLIADPVQAADSDKLNTFSAGLGASLAIGPSDGRFYYSENRANNNTSTVQPGLFVVDPNTGQTIFDSLQETLTLNPAATWDKLAAIGGMAISPDNKYLAFIVSATYAVTPGLPPNNAVGNQIDIVPLDATINGVSGLPDLSKMLVIPNAFPNNSGYARDISFDAADNIYAASVGDEMVRVFSPGGTSVDITSYAGGSYAFGQSLISPEPLGDANGDGIVNAADLTIIKGNMGEHVTGGYMDGDLNGDGIVNADDLTLYMLGLAEYQASLSAAPEPAGCAMALSGVVFALRRRVRVNVRH